jgi:hypothetical protein
MRKGRVDGRDSVYFIVRPSAAKPSKGSTLFEVSIEDNRHSHLFLCHLGGGANGKEKRIS